MKQQPRRRCPLYGQHAEMTQQVIHDHDTVIDCGILYRCPKCHFTEWAVMICDGTDDEADDGSET